MREGATEGNEWSKWRSIAMHRQEGSRVAEMRNNTGE